MAETLPTPIEDCPKSVEVALDPNSRAMKYIKNKLSTFSAVITNGEIVCPAINKKIGILVGAKPGNIFHLFCRELMEEKCPFANYEPSEI